MNKVFTMVGGHNVPAAGGVFTDHFILNDNNHSFNLKSITYDIQLFETATTKPLPLEMNQSQLFALVIQAIPVGSMLAEALQVVAAPATMANGTQIVMNRPNSYKFENFYVRNSLDILFDYVNMDAVKQFSAKYMLIIEIESLD